MQLHRIDNFNSVLRAVIRAAEGKNGEPNKQPRNIGDHTITFGYGYTFVRSGAPYVYLAKDLEIIGIELTEAQAGALKEIATAQGAELAKAAKDRNWTNTDQLIGKFIAGWEYVDLTATEADTLFETDVDHLAAQLKAKFRTVLGSDAKRDQLLASLAGTREWTAILSLGYNSPALVGKELINALWNQDRAEAWFNIRYGWGESPDANPLTNPNNGWAKRHYMESSVFGLYDDPGAVRLDEAQNAFRTLQLHRGRMEEREYNYSAGFDGTASAPDMIEQGNSTYASALTAAGVSIPYINDALNPAKYVLLAQLRQDNPSLADLDIAAYLATNIYLDPGREASSQSIDPNHRATLDARTNSFGEAKTSAVILIGEGGDDGLYGGAGDDILLGGEGNDALEGGRGADILIGGKGDDLYVWHTGDGKDKIIEERDADGLIHGRIKINDGTPEDILASGIFIEATDDPNVWYNPEHNIVLTHNSPWKLVLADGGEIQLGGGYDDFQDGDFGIHLHDALTAPETTRSIVGDFTPLDADPSQPGIQTSTDDLGNIVTDPGQLEPNRADTLYDSAGSDLVQGLGGDDVIHASRGGDDQIEGGTGRDRIEAGDGADLVLGGADSDIVNGGAGDDRIYGNDMVDIQAAIERGDSVSGSGQQGDWLNGGLGDDIVVGGDDNDVLFGGGCSDLIIGGAGDDVINAGDDYTAASFDWRVTGYGNPFDRQWSPVIAANFDSDGGGNDQAYGGNGNDAIFGLKGNDYLDGGAGNDVLGGDDGDDELFGGSGDDLMTGDYGNLAYDSGSGQVVQGNDYLDGEDGNDWLQGEGGQDQLFGGPGNDTLLGDATYLDGALHGADYLDGEDGDDLILGQGGSDVLYGGDGNDTVHGDDDTLAVAYHGNDELHGEGGNDYLVGGGGNDVLYGDDGDDTLFGEGLAAQDSNGDDVLDGGNGNDYLDGQGGNDLLDGGAGNDDLVGQSGDDSLDGGSGLDTLLGGAGNDTLFGGSEADSLFGDDGNDYLDGEDGNDILSGDAGDDEVSGGAGSDRLFGFAGTDTLDGADGNDELQGGDDADSLFGGTGDDLLAGQNGNDYLNGEDGNDALQGGDGIDTLYGGLGSDRLYGQADNDVLNGDEGVDELQGGNGNDKLYGGADDDILYGQNGDDTLDGGSGDDVLYGDGDTDTYVFGRGYGKDTIVNFDDPYRGTGVLQFNADVRPGDVHAYRQGDDLVLAIAGTDDAVTIENNFVMTQATYSYFYGYTYYYGNQVAEIKFADGTTWSSTNIPMYFGGSAGSDHISGTNNADVFGNSVGSDTMYGNAGSDTYLWGLHSGKDVIVDTPSGSDISTILIDVSLAPSDVTVRRVGNDCVLGIKNSPDELTIGGGSATRVYGRFQIKFDSDGTLWTYSDLFLTPTEQDDHLWGTSDSETIYGLGGNDTIVGGGGNDTIYGGSGDDSITISDGSAFLVDGGDGNDIISNGGYVYDNSTLRGGAGNDTLYDSYDAHDTLIGGTGDDVYFVSTYGGYSPSAVVEDPDAGIDTIFVSRNSYTLPDNAENLTLMDRDYSYNGTGIGNSMNNILTGSGGDNQLAGGAGDDTLDGAAGNDLLDGGVGNDTYLFGRGAGQDTITGETDGSGTLDTIRFANDVLPGVVRVIRDGNDLLLSVAGTSDRLCVSGYFAANAAIEEIQFLADNTIWDAAAIQTRLQRLPSEGDDLLLGSDSNDALNGLGGNDTMYGYAGDDTLDGGPGNDILVGGTGNDIYVLDNAADVIVENPNEGMDNIQSSVTYTLAANVEDLTLTGTTAINGTGNALDNFLVGNSANNALSGGAGSDTLDGGAGSDTLTGSTGNDTYLVDGLGDVIVEAAGEGTDTVQTNLSYTLAANLENLSLTGTSDINGTGNSVANALTGNAGSNVLDGAAGADTLQGGLGNDTYIVDNLADSMIENADEGVDTVQSSVTYALGANVENLVLTGTGAINGTGNNLNNLLAGNSANNVLAGGQGDDTYIVTSGDAVVENANEGIDSVQAAITHTLGANVENLTLTGTGRINGTGNALNNILIGNSANNSLIGGAGDDRLEGGGGTDTLIGGTGNDYYVVDDGKDVTTENANEGNDTVQASLTYTLGTNLENLVLAPNLAINGTGNAGNNVITGNALDNVLSGAAGADTIIGGGGNDTLVVDNVSDIVVENAGEGTDTVQSSVSYVLAANVDNLTLTGTAAINATGNALNNTLTGNSGANVLTGGAGNDVYVAGAGDTVVEYANEGVDTVQSAVTQVLSANLENLTLTGTSAINGTGNSLDNVLTGNSAANVLAGGLGNDTYLVDRGDSVVESANQGVDTVLSSGTLTLGANVENLTLTGASAINGTGNGLDNVLSGNSAANVLTGGAGNDIYNVGTGDTVVEVANQGIDTVQSSVTVTLGANIENLVLTGTAAAGGTGNALDNVLTGNTANNVLDGGAGNDRLIGSLGDDTYVLDSAGDVVVENADEGTDTVQTYFSFASGGNIENVTLLGTSAISATGDTGNNLLTGNSAANTLTGGAGNDTLNGGGGADTLIGGIGDDTYTMATGVVTVENANEGTDTVQTATTFTLGANYENLTLTGTAATNGTGNGLNNVITGNAGNNVLDGVTGADTLYGGDGNDTIVGNADDGFRGGAGDDLYVIDYTGELDGSTTYNYEYGGGGTDTIQTNGSVQIFKLGWDYVIQDYTFYGTIENVTLTGVLNTQASGNVGNNVLIGNAGNNSLYGLAGDDRMDGGDGNDYLDGGQGNNTLIGGAGDDKLECYNGYGLNSMYGGAGNDTYVVNIINGTGDSVFENANEGIDTITVDAYNSSTYTLVPNVEKLNLSNYVNVTTLTGNGLNNWITGNGYAATISGGAGDDTLDGGGGADTLVGGTGNDTYIVDASDVLIENASEGVDTVQAYFTHALAANLENLTLTGTAAINGTGNALNNGLIGNTANNSLTGGAGDDRLDGGGGTDTLIGGAGDDTYVIDTLDTVSENANEGTDTIQAAFSYALGANLENLTLTGTAALNGSGNASNNVLTGNAGNNTLDGSAGIDTMLGGLGNDTYVVDNSGDVVTESVSEGTDTVLASATYALSANVENLTLTGTASINGTGNSLNNVLTGNSATNTLSGGLGDDTYVVVDALDTILENANEGSDTVQASASYTLGANLENLTLTGYAAINGTGNALNNTLTGSGISNVLAGGLGDDTYCVDSRDTIIESQNEGIDTVRSSSDFTLGANIENLILTAFDFTNTPSNAGYYYSYNGTGNDLNNALTGNLRNNVLDGGAGADTMQGGRGNDTYIVDDSADVIVENANEGNDSVQSSLSYALGANVENLTLAGTAAINATGNVLDNVLTGNTGTNVLTGGLGNDVYVVDGGDTVIEYANEGIDTVQSSVTYALGANVENLTLIGYSINGIGSELDNILIGSSGNNRLTAGAGNDYLDGGSGIDTLEGGIGDDIYVVDTTAAVIAENAGEGSDTVKSSVTYTLGANLENLTLTGNASINGTGNALNNVLMGNDGSDVLAGGLGDDTYVVDCGDTVVETANEGIDIVQSSGTCTLSANVENLTLTGTLAIDGTGNELGNVLVGNVADNTLDGQAGADTMFGGAGNDTYLVDDAGDVVTELANEGIDTVQSAVDYVLGDNLENLSLDYGLALNGTGNALNNTLFGGMVDNVLTGLGGDDTLDGSYGADTLVGGIGNDTYVVDNLGDVVVENAGEGVDTVRSTIDYVLAGNLENLTLASFAAVRGTGNALNNVMIGSSNNNVLDGAAGADAMSGGTGDDTYVVDNAGDTVNESNYEGKDTVLSSVTFTLGANVEDLTLTGSAAINATGNDTDNVLVGNGAINILTGSAGNDSLDGGAGADVMIGGDGNDIYVVDEAGDLVQETSGYYGGNDRVLSSLSYALGANVEDLALTGTDAVNAVGNELNNMLIGNAAANVLDGGTGSDVMVGGLGDDIYVVDDLGDWVGEYAGEGMDSVRSSISYTLGPNLENLLLTGNAGIDGTGNGLDNLLVGNGADNNLNGAEGNDVLQGGAGNDTLQGGVGNKLLDGGAGTDSLAGGSGNDMFICGLGNDFIATGSGANVIAFNRGNGQDTVGASAGADNILSLGGGIRLDDLALRKNGNNLVVDTGNGDAIILQDWYAAATHHSVLTLQMIEAAAADFNPSGNDALRDNNIETFDFQGLANRFDQTLAANPGLTSWSLTQALTDFHLGGSDTEALGGDLAYQYGAHGTLTGIGVTAVQSVLGSSNFGSQPQTLQPPASLQAGTIQLS